MWMNICAGMMAETRKMKAMMATSTHFVCGTMSFSTGRPNSDSMSPLHAQINKAATAKAANRFKAVSLMSIQ